MKPDSHMGPYSRKGGCRAAERGRDSHSDSGSDRQRDFSGRGSLTTRTASDKQRSQRGLDCPDVLFSGLPRGFWDSRKSFGCPVRFKPFGHPARGALVRLAGP